MQAWVYMLLCADGRYYVGSYRGDDVGLRVSEHNAGVHPTAWTYHRRPVELVWADWFQRMASAIAFERQLKGWTRAKKEAFLRGEWDKLSELAVRRGKFVKRPL
jgi:putative endonuclease